MIRTDVAVIGLGVHGSAVSRELAARKWRVLGVEQSPRDQVWGASGGPVRMFRENDPHRASLGPLARESAEQWRLLSRESGRRLVRSVPAVLLATGADRRRPNILRARGRRLERVAPDDPLLRGLALADGWACVRDPDCALLDASASVLALREGAGRAGARLVFGQRVELGGDRPAERSTVTLRVGDEEVAAGTLLICAGAWTVRLPGWARLPGLRVDPAHLQLATFRNGPGLPEPGAFYLVSHGDERFCVVPFGPEGRLQFGHFAAPAGASRLSAEELVRVTRRRDLEALTRFYPRVGEARNHTTVRAGYTQTPDGAFVLRWVAPRVATLVACSGVGFKYAPAIARRVVAAVAGDDPPGDGVRVERWP
ncbi:FAD-binding oxidoreductase [Streptomyces sp. B6B3]|uniref:NAD(P)/FAD-dependent oxidoreductase n=1 Tax=Streptomyces sp. B6B3 TaxID=3153570 RepID=UPI00325E0325